MSLLAAAVASAAPRRCRTCRYGRICRTCRYVRICRPPARRFPAPARRADTPPPAAARHIRSRIARASTRVK